ncbi:alanine/glycine:cation symporter family protein [Buchananella hordeovulneris]|uniref:alanine/glycine:cation symporter family protein n=1 Tax=Buchananella hordeovulneris TaxID=52770 RepID=UPI000F5F3411|nr:sodium:alanine symporter family protein [Buchananella hordeovulneris]RRD42287.1 alanine:cation symporter family protein [Buchananella hordeovulneris]
MRAVLETINDYLYGYVLVALLVIVGIFCTLLTRGGQFTLLPDAVRSLVRSRRASHGITSFQAFAVGIASRVGIGNIAGVALALILGGPGALFWMWVVALVGMATSLAESVLAQLFKRRHPDGSYRGGPAFYMEHGLGSRTLGKVFAALFIFAVGLCVCMVQANTVAGIFAETHQVPTWVTGIFLMALVAPVVLGGVRSVARVTEWLAPSMALLYVAMVAVIIALHLPAVPGVFVDIFQGAFGWGEAAAGTTGGVLATVLHGARRGLFSNEAGLGTAPNAAGTATVAHPVSQGLIQSLGVFLDTIIVCTATGLAILVTGTSLAVDPKMGAVLTQQAVVSGLGQWTATPVAVIILVFAYSTLLGCYSYSQVNIDFLGHRRHLHLLNGVVVTVAAGLGSVLELKTVWALSDIALGLLGILNLVTILVLSPWVLALLRDYRAQRARGVAEPVFDAAASAGLPRLLPTDAWSRQADVG